MPDWSYHPILRPALFHLPSAAARDLTLGAMGGLAALPLGAALIEALGDMRPAPAQRRCALGIEFAGPVGLGAGLDVHTAGLAALARFGFGYIEIGPVTQAPVRALGRIERDVAQGAIRYPDPLANDGVAALEARLRRLAPLPVPLAIRLACRPGADAPEAAAERCRLIARLAPFAAFFTLDTRNGATDGSWDAASWSAHLHSVLTAVHAHAATCPILLCVAPDLDANAIESQVASAVALGINGVLVAGGVRAAQGGRCVGTPTRLASHTLVADLHRQWGDRLVIIGSGGIAAPEDALRLLDAGATLVQIESGLVYAGPGLPKRINEAVAYREQCASRRLSSPSAAPPHDDVVATESADRSRGTRSERERPDGGATGRLRSLTRAGWPWIALLGAAMVGGGLAAWLIGVLWVVLPYDLAFVGMTRAQLMAANPRLLAFMAHDRITLAGTMISIGVLYAGMALFGMREGWSWARRAVVVSASCGFAGYFVWLGTGYVDPLHTAVTILLLPLFVLGWRARPPALAVGPRPNQRNSRRWHMGLWAQLLFIGCGVGMTVAGLTIAVVGMTRVFVPEDLEFLRTTPAALHALGPRLIPLIAHDRAGLGGALVADGLAVLLLALWGFREGAAWIWWTLLGAGVPGFAAALGVHVAIGYLNLWHLAPALLACGAFAVAMCLGYPYLCHEDQAEGDGVASAVDDRARAMVHYGMRQGSSVGRARH